MIMESDIIMIMEDLFIVLMFLKNYKHYNFLNKSNTYFENV